MNPLHEANRKQWNASASWWQKRTGERGRWRRCGSFILESPYFKRGPFEYQSDEGLAQFEFHWTVSDHVQALLSAGCELVKMEETGDQNDDWNATELTGLPQYLLLVGKKRKAILLP